MRVSQERRRALHARIVDAIERRYPERLTEHVEHISHHAQRGEAWNKALTYLRLAGYKAAARSANREAVAWFEQALVALEHLPQSRDTLEHAVDLRFDLRNSLLALGEYGQIFEYLREAEAIAEGLEDQRRLVWISSYMATSFWWTGDPDRAIESGQRALAIATELGEFALQVQTGFRLGMTYHGLGDYPRAQDILRRNVEALRGDLVRERLGLPGLPAVQFRAWLAWCLADLGEFAEGATHGEAAVRIAESVDHTYSLVIACLGVGVLYLRKGNLQAAIRVLERDLVLCQAANIPFFVPQVAPHLGAAYVLSLRMAEAVSLLERARDQAAAMKLMSFQSLRVAHLSEAYLLAGRLEDVIGLAGEALALSRDQQERGNEAYVLRLLGEITSLPISRMLSGPQATTAKPVPWLRSLACAPSWPTAASALASSPGARAITPRPTSTPPPR
jgi:tetratricopeptide (TPR) repeat protein